MGLGLAYQGHEFPETLPLPSSARVLPVIYHQVQESEEYPVSGLDSDPQWFSLTSSSFGYVRLGKSKRLFMVTMFHELHCLRILNLAFEPHHIESGHINHCLDYLRQAALCSADLTLEKGDFTQRDFASSNKTGEVHMCRDWRMVYQVMDDNLRDWVTK